MNSREFRSMAREKLQNRWGQAAITMLIYGLCVFGISLVLGFIPLIGQIVSYVISPVLTFGLLKQWIKFKNNEEVGYADFFQLGFENFVMVWKVILRVALKLLPPMILMFAGLLLTPSLMAMTRGSNIAAVLGIIISVIGMIWLIPVSYKYMCVTNELAYDSNRSSKEIVEQSGAYMVGNRMRIFLLQFSFIGWAILASLTCAIGCLWLTPYIQIATILFYESISGRSNSYEPVNVTMDNGTVISGDDPIQ